MILNPNAYGVHLKDLIEGINDTFYRVPELIFDHCRAENENAEIVKISYRKIGITKK